MSKNFIPADSVNSDVLKYLPVKVIPALSGVISIYLLTRILSTDLYGIYAFITASTLLFGQLVSGWVSSSIIFFYHDYDKDNSLEHLKSNFIYLQLSLLFLGSIGFAIVSYLGVTDWILVFFGILILIFQSLLNLVYSFLQAERRIGSQVKATFIQSVLQISGLYFCYLFGSGHLYFVMAALVASYLVTVHFVFWKAGFYRFFASGKWIDHFDLVLCKKVLLYGLPVCIWFFASQFYAVGDRLLLRFYGVGFLVGNYASFRDLAVGLSGFITMPLLMASHPIIMSIWKSGEGKDQIEGILINNIKLLITAFTIVILGTMLLGDWVLSLIVETKYFFPNDLMLLVVLVVFFSTVSMYLHKGLEATANTVLMAKVAIAVSAFSLTLNMIFIPLFGVYSSCVIAVLSQIMYCGVVYNFSRHVFQIRIQVRFLLKHIMLVSIFYLFLKAFNFLEFKLYWRFGFFAISSLYLILSSQEVLLMARRLKI